MLGSSADVFHETKNLLQQLKRTLPDKGRQSMVETAITNLEFMYGQMALLEDREPNDFEPDDLPEGDVW